MKLETSNRMNTRPVFSKTSLLCKFLNAGLYLLKKPKIRQAQASADIRKLALFTQKNTSNIFNRNLFHSYF